MQTISLQCQTALSSALERTQHLPTLAKLKEEGVLNGVADVLLLVPNSEYHGLCIEFKVGYNKQSPQQVIFQKSVEDAGYKYIVCKDFTFFQQVLDEYLNV